MDFERRAGLSWATISLGPQPLAPLEPWTAMSVSSAPTSSMRRGMCICFKGPSSANKSSSLSLGAGRFLKTVKGRHKNGPVVIKIFVKPDPGISLRNYRRRLKSVCYFLLCCPDFFANEAALVTVEREALADIPNVYSHQTFFETDKAGYILRQWVSSNLYDRLR